MSDRSNPIDSNIPGRDENGRRDCRDTDPELRCEAVEGKANQIVQSDQVGNVNEKLTTPPSDIDSRQKNVVQTSRDKVSPRGTLGTQEVGTNTTELGESSPGRQGSNPAADHKQLKGNGLVSRRRLIERLSGWRLIGFFVSMFLNVGLLVALIELPLILDPARLFVAAAMVFGSHCVFLIAIAGFRFSVSRKLALGLSHAGACIIALLQINAMPRLMLGQMEVTTVYSIPILTLMITGGGILMARWAGFHRSHHFTVIDLLLLLTTFAILFPLMQRQIPQYFWSDGNLLKDSGTAFFVAALSGITGLVVTNAFLRILPGCQTGKSPAMIAIGWFLLTAIVDWNLCQFGVLVGLWIVVSLAPVLGFVGAIKIESTAV